MHALAGNNAIPTRNPCCYMETKTVSRPSPASLARQLRPPPAPQPQRPRCSSLSEAASAAPGR